MMKSSNARTNLTQGNIDFIQLSLNEDRERLLLKFKSLETDMIEAKDNLDQFDQTQPVVIEATRRLKGLVEKKKKVVADVADVMDDEKSKSRCFNVSKTRRNSKRDE